MPKIEAYRGGVAPQRPATPQVGQDAAGGIRSATNTAIAVVQDADNLFAQIRQRAENARVNSVIGSTAKLQHELLNVDTDQRKSAYGRKGENAIGVSLEVMTTRDQEVAKLLSGLNSPRQKMAAAEKLDAMSIQFAAQLQRHEAREIGIAEKAAFEVGVAQFGNLAVAYATDAKASSAEIGRGVALIDQYGKDNGWGEDVISGYVREFRSNALTGAIQSLIDLGQVAEARAQFDTVKGMEDGDGYFISPAARTAIEPVLRKHEIESQAREVQIKAFEGISKYAPMSAEQARGVLSATDSIKDEDLRNAADRMIADQLQEQNNLEARSSNDAFERSMTNGRIAAADEPWLTSNQRNAIRIEQERRRGVGVDRKTDVVAWHAVWDKLSPQGKADLHMPEYVHLLSDSDFKSYWREQQTIRKELESDQDKLSGQMVDPLLNFLQRVDGETEIAGYDLKENPQMKHIMRKSAERLFMLHRTANKGQDPNPEQMEQMLDTLQVDLKRLEYGLIPGPIRLAGSLIPGSPIRPNVAKIPLAVRMQLKGDEAVGWRFPYDEIPEDAAKLLAQYANNKGIGTGYNGKAQKQDVERLFVSVLAGELDGFGEFSDEVLAIEGQLPYQPTTTGKEIPISDAYRDAAIWKLRQTSEYVPYGHRITDDAIRDIYLDMRVAEAFKEDPVEDGAGGRLSRQYKALEVLRGLGLTQQEAEERIGLPSFMITEQPEPLRPKPKAIGMGVAKKTKRKDPV